MSQPCATNGAITRRGGGGGTDSRREITGAPVGPCGASRSRSRPVARTPAPGTGQVGPPLPVLLVGARRGAIRQTGENTYRYVGTTGSISEKSSWTPCALTGRLPHLVILSDIAVRLVE